jgi:predicted nucleic acid-binding protein
MIPARVYLQREASDLAWKLDGEGKPLPAQDLLIPILARRAGALVLTKDQHLGAIPAIRTLA